MRKNLTISVGLGIVTAFICFLIVSYFQGPVGDDLFFHFLRISGIVENINNGTSNYINNMVSINGYNFGYGNPIFYKDTMIYPIIYIFHFFTENVAILYQIITGIYWVIGYVISSFVYFKIRPKLVESQIFALLYALCQYHLHDFFKRAALSEFIAMAFLPLLILAAFKIYEGLKDENSNGKEYIWFVISMCLFSYSHMLSVFIAFYIYIYFIIIYLVVFKKKRVYLLKHLTISSLFILLIISSIMYPIIEQLLSSSFHFQNERWPGRIINISPTRGAKLDIGFLTYLYYSFTYLYPMNIAYIIIGFGIVWSDLVKRKDVFIMKLFFVLGIVLFICLPGLIKFDDIPLLKNIQFKYRLASYIYLVLSFLLVYITKYKKDKKKYLRNLVLLTVTLTVISLAIGRSDTIELRNQFNDISDYNNYSHRIGSGSEYLNAETEKKDYVTFEENGSKTIYKLGEYNIQILDEEKNLFELPITYYKGYEASDDVVISKSDKGFIEAKVPEGIESFVIKYVATPIQKWSKILTLFGIILFIIYELILYGELPFFKNKLKQSEKIVS